MSPNLRNSRLTCTDHAQELLEEELALLREGTTVGMPQNHSGERGKLRRRQRHTDLTGEQESELLERQRRLNRVSARIDGMYRKRAYEQLIEPGTPEAAALYRECRKRVYDIMYANREHGYQNKSTNRGRWKPLS